MTGEQTTSAAPAGPTGAAAGFARALAEKDFGRIAELLDPAVDFRALTPSRSWEASRPSDVVAHVLRSWLDDRTHVDALEELSLDRFANCQRVGYRLRGRDGDGPFVVEQQAHVEESEGRITWMRVLCSGFRSPA